MAGLLQTVKPVAASNNALQATTPVKTKVGNKKVTPVKSTGRAFNPRNPDGTIKYTGGPVESPLSRYTGDSGTTISFAKSPTVSAPPTPRKSTGTPMTGDDSLTKTPGGSLGGSGSSGGSSGGLLSGDGDRPEKVDTRSYISSVGPAPAIDIPEINAEEIDIRDLPDGYDSVEGREYSYDPNLRSSKEVAQPDAENVATVTDANRPNVQSGNYDSIEQPGVTEADYTDIDAPKQSSDGLTAESSVAKQLNGLLSEDNPYIQQARQQAAEAAAARGLRNSSMAVQAGQEAAIRQALPIAQQDAQQSFQLERDASQANYATDMAQYQAELQGRRDATLQKYGLDRAGYEAMLQGERDRVMQEYNLDSRQYDAAMQEIRDQNLQQYQLDQQQYQAGLQNIRDQNLNELDKDKMTLQQQFTQDLEQLRYRQQQGLMDRESELQLRQLEKNTQLQQQRDLLLQQMQERTDTMRHAQQMQAMQREFEQKMAGMQAEMDHQNRLNYTNAATQTQVAAMEQIGMIYQNPEMTPEQQRAAVNGVYEKLEETYDTLEGLYGNLPGVDFAPREDDINSGRPGGGRDTFYPNPGAGGGSGGGGSRKPGGRDPSLEGLRNRV